jgi:hypothetical protein
MKEIVSGINFFRLKCVALSDGDSITKKCVPQIFWFGEEVQSNGDSINHPTIAFQT